MPSSRDSFRRNRVAPVVNLYFTTYRLFPWSAAPSCSLQLTLSSKRQANQPLPVHPKGISPANPNFPLIDNPMSASENLIYVSSFHSGERTYAS